MRELRKEILVPGISAQRWFDIVYATNEFDTHFHKELKSWDVKLGLWDKNVHPRPGEESPVWQRSNEFKSILELPDILKNMIGANHSHVTETERTFTSKDGVINIHQSSRLEGPPFSEAYLIEVNWRAKTVLKGTQLEMYAKVAFQRSWPLVDTVIESQMMLEVDQRVAVWEKFSRSFVNERKVTSGRSNKPIPPSKQHAKDKRALRPSKFNTMPALHVLAISDSIAISSSAATSAITGAESARDVSITSTTQDGTGNTAGKSDISENKEVPLSSNEGEPGGATESVVGSILAPVQNDIIAPVLTAEEALQNALAGRAVGAKMKRSRCSCW